MGPITLDKRITNAMPTWGGNYDSTVGNNHNSEADTLDSEITDKSITLNIMSKMNPDESKPSSKNPGFDKGFWAKADPQMDTQGHGTLTRKLKD